MLLRWRLSQRGGSHAALRAEASASSSNRPPSQLLAESAPKSPGCLNTEMVSGRSATIITLDADTVSTWHPDFQDLVYKPQVWAEIDRKLKASCTYFLSQLTCTHDSLQDDLAKTLRDEAQEIFQSRYSAVIGYHGCRPRDIQTYKSFGILPSNTQSLIEEARVLFHDIPSSFDEALVNIDQHYLAHNEGKIGLLLSRLYASKDPFVSYYHGSELIRAIAFRMGIEAQKRFQDTGRPTFIKCSIPINWLDEYTTFPVRDSYCNQIVEELIRLKKWPEEEFMGFSGGYMLTTAIPAANILEFIEVLP